MLTETQPREPSANSCGACLQDSQGNGLRLTNTLLGKYLARYLQAKESRLLSPLLACTQTDCRAGTGSQPHLHLERAACRLPRSSTFSQAAEKENSGETSRNHTFLLKLASDKRCNTACSNRHVLTDADVAVILITDFGGKH